MPVQAEFDRLEKDILRLSVETREYNQKRLEGKLAEIQAVVNSDRGTADERMEYLRDLLA